MADRTHSRQCCATTLLLCAVLLLVVVVTVVRADPADSFPPCTFSTPVATACVLNVRQLKPTEFAYGAIELSQTLRDTNERIKKGRFDAWSARNKVPIVIGPAKSQDENSNTSLFDHVGAEFWVVDHHHRVLGVYRSDLAWDQKNLVCEVVQNYSDMSKHEFFRTIVNKQLVWLADHKGLYPLDPTLLPETFAQMHPDPYRDLAAYVRSQKGFRATSILYAEFHWANYFRTVLPWPTKPQEERLTEWCKIRPYSTECTERGMSELEWIESVLPTAVQMAHSPQASHLPGYIGGV